MSRRFALILLGALLWLGAPLPVYSATGSAGGSEDMRSVIMFTVAGDEVGFDVGRAAGGAEVVVSIGAPPGAVVQTGVDPDDPLVAGVSIDPDVNPQHSLVRIFLREHDSRVSAQILRRPFRIVLDVVHVKIAERTSSRYGQSGSSSKGSASLFLMNVPVRIEHPPLDMAPTVRGPIEGPGADQFASAYAGYSHREWAQSGADFKTFLETFPKSRLAAAADYLQADIQYREAWGEGLPSRAAAAKRFDELMQRYPRSPNRPMSLLRMAEVLMTEAKWEEAKPLTEWVLSDYANTPFVRIASLMRAQIAMGQNHVRTAVAHYAEVRASRVDDPVGVSATFGLAESLVRMGRYAEAIQLYEQGLRRDPGHAKGDIHQLKMMGRALTEAGRYDDARHVFLVLYNVFPTEYPAGVALTQVADTFRGEGLWEMAERGYLDVLSLYQGGEGALTARMSLGDLYVDRHDTTSRHLDLNTLSGGRMTRSSQDELMA